ncbi:hypothetical protein ACOMHN_006152 [Nucella lapillus]
MGQNKLMRVLSGSTLGHPDEDDQPGDLVGHVARRRVGKTRGPLTDNVEMVLQRIVPTSYRKQMKEDYQNAKRMV